MQEVTARLKGEHPTGERWRGGVKWGYSWQTVELSADDAAKVAADDMLEVLDAPAEETPAVTVDPEAETVIAVDKPKPGLMERAKKAVTGKK